MGANIPRKHHYVPQVLLRGFTRQGTNDGTLYVIDHVQRKTYPSTPKGTGKETDYNLVQADGVDPFIVEQTLLAETIEGPAASALDTIRNGALPDEEGRERALCFMAMQAIRSPNRRDALDRFETEVARKTAEMMFEDEATLERARQFDPDLADLTTRRSLGSCPRSGSEERPHRPPRRNAPIVRHGLKPTRGRSWTVMVAPHGEDFVCCDDPVVIQPSGTRSPLAPRGFGSADTLVFMPVGRGHALVGSWPIAGMKPTWLVQQADAHTVAVMNTGPLLLTARRFVASAEERFSFWLNTGIKDRAAYVDIVMNRPVLP